MPHVCVRAVSELLPVQVLGQQPSVPRVSEREHLDQLLDDSITLLILTNPNTMGLFEEKIIQIALLVHAPSGLF